MVGFSVKQALLRRSGTGRVGFSVKQALLRRSGAGKVGLSVKQALLRRSETVMVGFSVKRGFLRTSETGKVGFSVKRALLRRSGGWLDNSPKSLRKKRSFAATGNRIQIYDFVTAEGNSTKHIDDLIGPELNSNSPLHTPGYTWPFVNGPHQWCPGVHKFFGWLAKDANMSAPNTPENFFGQGFGFNEHVLTIPQVAFTKDTPQFDFMYSNIFVTEPINNPVPLEFSHLFSAFYITGENKQDETIYDIKSISISGLNNTQSATIDYSPGNETGTATPIVTYTDTGASSYEFFFDFSSTDTTLSNEDGQKNLTGIYLMWPQKAEYFADAKLTLNYTYVVGGSESTAPEKEIDLSSMASWEPGQIKRLNLVFNVDQITFRIEELVDWNDEAEKDIPVQM